MPIHKVASLAEAQAIAGPSVIVRNGDHFLVLTGADIPSAQAPAPTRELSVQEFRQRFTDAEQAAIVGSTDAAVKVLVFKISTRSSVDLDDPQVVQGLDLLVAKSLLAAPRKAQILA